MIRRVKVQGYKSLKDVEVELQPLTVIFGPNAAGKSNLFDALALLSRMVTERTLRDAFEGHRGAPLEAFFHGEKGLEALLSEATAQFGIEVDVEISDAVASAVEERIHAMRGDLPDLDATDADGSKPRQRIIERCLRYALRVEILTSSGHLRVVDERLCALKSDGAEKQSRNPFIEPDKGKLVLRMEGQAHPFQRELGLDHTLVSSPLYEPHFPHLTAFREELARWRFYYLEPRELMRRDNPLQEARSLDSSGANLAAFFNTLKASHPTRFDDVNQTIPSFLPRVQIAVERTRTGALQLKVFEDGVPFSSGVISEGTLRVLGLLAITNALTPATVVGYEEPENGIHPRRLQLIADLLKGVVEATQTQFLINTHSPHFPESFEDGQLINCRKDGPFTTFERGVELSGIFRHESIERGLDDRNDDGGAVSCPPRLRAETT